MENRKYFIVTVPNENMIHALDVCIGDNEDQRWNLAEDELLVKTTDDLINTKINSGVSRTKIFPKGLTTEYTYEEVLALMGTIEWVIPLV